ncbi:aspartate-semialdehyde dehydrogenase [Virgibacillus halophilus]|uniref:aspartate-semialdehyde dehydrogenase n=1 Tax=Tigheibacillus halophilus TaxID=361280 RepID=UPI0036446CC4
MGEKPGYHVAVVGATGAVGERIIELLHETDMPLASVKLLASARSAGKKVSFKGETIEIEEAVPESFKGIDIALFSAGGSISKQLAPEAVKRGAVVVDNTSAYRMDENVPLVVPEVNANDLKKHQGIIANPNCSTIQMVAALKPIQDAFGMSRIIVSTYQAVSGSGATACTELENQSESYLQGTDMQADILPVKSDKKHYPIAFNALPQIDVFGENDYTFEEMKMVNETKKIMHAPELKVAATCVRLPFFRSHAESVYVEVEKEGLNAADIREILEKAPGVTVQDNPAEQDYPTPLSAEGRKEVFVGRIRKDLDESKGFHLWIVSDNLLKGAAWNTVQIAEQLAANHLLS